MVEVLAGFGGGELEDRAVPPAGRAVDQWLMFLRCRRFVLFHRSSLGWRALKVRSLVR